VAAILKFSLPISQIEATLTTRPGGAYRGDAQGGIQRSALKPLLRGEPRHRCVQALFAGASGYPPAGQLLSCSPRREAPEFDLHVAALGVMTVNDTVNTVEGEQPYE
jgi:hypothetical protein